MSEDELRADLARFLGFGAPPARVSSRERTRTPREGYEEIRLDFAAEGAQPIPALMLVPAVHPVVGGVLIQHQHASEWHWGKSEVAGLVGNPLQAFGPVLARRGWVVLAPDAIGFEDRRAHVCGIERGSGNTDWLNHFNAMAHRLVQGDMLMRCVLVDAAAALTLLSERAELAGRPIGTLGHSMGGNTALFHAAVDQRVQFACASGAACSYRHKLAAGTGIEMSEILPGFASHWDIEDLIRATAPRPLLLLSATNDPYSADADDIEQRARGAYEARGESAAFVHLRDGGSHEMTQERFTQIVDWIARQAEKN